MNLKRFVLASALVLAGLTASQATVRLPHILGDHMVLQQQAKANLWGWADANAQVTITCSWNQQAYTTKCNAKGEWLQAVDTPEAGGPYEITISDGTELKVTDVLIGEVWVCAGQSNMEMPVGGYGGGQYAEHGQDYIMKANPKRPLRVANLSNAAKATPQDDCNVAWATNTPTTVRYCGATAFFFANYVQEVLDIPVGIILTCWGGSNIETWMDRETLDKIKPGIDYAFLNDLEHNQTPAQQSPTLLYNGMLYPFHNYTIKGAIWYQGESNRENYQEYTALQKGMIELWRKIFRNPEMPFYYVEIAPFVYEGSDNFKSGFLREAQAKCMKEVDNCGMAVTVDVGEEFIIHPCKKEEVGKRLAYWALGQTYKLPIQYASPEYDSLEIQGGRAIVHFKDDARVAQGLHHEPDKMAPLEGFEVAGEDKVFHKAEARIGNDSKSVYVSCPEVPAPVAVRYCFRNYQPGYLYNNFGLPVGPFRTDNWEK